MRKNKSRNEPPNFKTEDVKDVFKMLESGWQVSKIENNIQKRISELPKIHFMHIKPEMNMLLELLDDIRSFELNIKDNRKVIVQMFNELLVNISYGNRTLL